jgi:hypothetical protein
MGYLHGAHAVLPYFKRQQWGVLINNISVGGWFPVPYGVGYSASKFGLRGFSEALRGELRKYPNIFICDLFPAFLDTPGIQHSGNYTGKILKPAPPVYDPQRLAKAMVSVVKYPRKSVTVGSTATFLKLAHFFFPTLSRTVTAKLVETYLNKAEPTASTNGNLFEPADYGSSIHGGWNTSADQEQRKKIVLRSLLIAGATAAIVFGAKKISNNNSTGLSKTKTTKRREQAF